MPSTNKGANKPSHVSTGSVFNDLGLTRTEVAEARIKSDLWRDLVAQISPLALSQNELAKRLGVHQPDVSNLLKGKLSKVSVGTLIHYAVKLDLKFEARFVKPKAKRTVLKTVHGSQKDPDLLQV